MNPHSRTRLSVERLDDRCCPSVSATLVNGNLLVTATEPTFLEIAQAGPNTFQVGELYSGTNAVIDGVTGDVVVRLSDHNDVVTYYPVGWMTPDDLYVDLGGGSNELNLGADARGGGIGGDLAILGGSGRDTVLIGDSLGFSELRIHGYTAISTGEGDDYLDIGSLTQVNFQRSAAILLGGGNDYVYNGAYFYERSYFHLGDGDDVLVNGGFFFERSHVFGGRGTDTFMGHDSNGTLLKHGFEIENQ